MKVSITTVVFLLISSLSYAGGLPGVKSGEYLGKNHNGGNCIVDIMRSRIEHFNNANEGTYRDYVRKRFERDSDNPNLFVYEAIEIAYNVFVTLEVDDKNRPQKLVFNEGGYGGLREWSCEKLELR